MLRIKIDPEKQYSALAIIALEEGNERKYLLQWNASWRVFNLIGGKLDNNRGDNNSLARTIYREIEEELGLRSEEECLILNQVLNLEIHQYSRREKRYKDYFFSVFEVDLFPRLPLAHDQRIYAARWLSTGRENFFATKQEIMQLKTNDGKAISKTTRLVLQSLGDLPPSLPG